MIGNTSFVSGEYSLVPYTVFRKTVVGALSSLRYLLTVFLGIPSFVAIAFAINLQPLLRI
jgi:hypothetical protein